MNDIRPTIKLRMYAAGFGIATERRDKLLAIADNAVTQMSRDMNADAAARDVVASCASVDEVRFVCHGVDVFLKSRFNAPYGARAQLYCDLQQQCFTAIENRAKQTPPA